MKLFGNLFLFALLILSVPTLAAAQSEREKNWGKFLAEFVAALKSENCKTALKPLMASEKDFRTNGGTRDEWLKAIDCKTLLRPIESGFVSYGKANNFKMTGNTEPLLFEYKLRRWRFNGVRLLDNDR